LLKERIMPNGWTRDGAIHDQIAAATDFAVQSVRAQLPKGKSSANCVRCDAVIPETRRAAVPGVRHCVKCQSELEK